MRPRRQLLVLRQQEPSLQGTEARLDRGLDLGHVHTGYSVRLRGQPHLYHRFGEWDDLEELAEDGDCRLLARVDLRRVSGQSSCVSPSLKYDLLITVFSFLQPFVRGLELPLIPQGLPSLRPDKATVGQQFRPGQPTGPGADR